MQNAMKINDDVTVGPQPTIAQLEQLKQEGFKSVINFRADGEDQQQMSPLDEGEKVRELGMEYLHVPVTMQTMGEHVVDHFRAKYPDLPKPVFGHCQAGKRAGAMVMMHVACKNGLSGEQTLQKAQEMGFECDQPELVEFVKSYVDKHSQKS